MTTRELRRFLSYLNIKLENTKPYTDERREIVELRAIIKRELDLKALAENPNTPYIRQSTGE